MTYSSIFSFTINVGWMKVWKQKQRLQGHLGMGPAYIPSIGLWKERPQGYSSMGLAHNPDVGSWNKSFKA